jgi:hypothetical protein
LLVSTLYSDGNPPEPEAGLPYDINIPLEIDAVHRTYAHGLCLCLGLGLGL